MTGFYRTKHSLSRWPSNSTSGHLSQYDEKQCSLKILHTNAHSIFHHSRLKKKKNWSNLDVSNFDNWLNKLWNIRAMEYNSTLKSNEPVIHTAAWMDLKRFIPREKTQSQRLLIAWFHLYNALEWQNYRDQKPISGCQGLGCRLQQKQVCWQMNSLRGTCDGTVLHADWLDSPIHNKSA